MRDTSGNIYSESPSGSYGRTEIALYSMARCGQLGEAIHSAMAWAVTINRTSGSTVAAIIAAPSVNSVDSPEQNWLKVNTDNSVNLSTMEASCGGVGRDYNGEWIFGLSESIGRCSILQAVLWAVLNGLNIA
ncbi:hypothetical protein F3Y22_tig00001644pilonHSYRG00268 [Hibiscus syriacus]|uniref:Uncharacterized protein n=1 Tax=Hibiscus syriacus TaxID=106335 RepID=A0A6A3D133_HIBSY|nr:hypothetical protein F3Y22_tig00001644pilonHSYRG00268 [Hibiscus syriacus]